ncbi:DUF4350 domain-containing protein [Alloiococcus sp. CFN-8]|uniref:DUF4350 domain-containing protein n=1 Tax=Alloiococcus sp. CFN-8 TaxID=3416081 RepID=UPI003CE99D57
MKKPIRKEFIILIVIIPILIFVSYFVGVRREGSLPNYSVINKSNKGLSVFYEALEELGYNTERTTEPLKDEDYNEIIVLTESYNYYLAEDDEILSWVESGGDLFYIREGGNSYLDTKVPAIDNEYFSIYMIGEGRILDAEPDYISNVALTEDIAPAYEVFMGLEELGSKDIVFNEYYLYGGSEEKTLWQSVPVGLKIILLQLILALGAWYYYKGKAFGRAVPYYEEEERQENEYIYNTASIYRRVEAYDLMAQAYYSGLLKPLRASSDNFLSIWEKEELPGFQEAKKVQTFMEDTFFKGKSLEDEASQYLKANKKVNNKEYIEIINLMEELRTVLNKRRDSKWKIAGI